MAAILLGGALLISLYLGWQALTGSGVAGCAAGSGCDRVLGSRWSSLFGIPVSLFGAVLYGFLLTEVLRRREAGPSHDRWVAVAGCLVLAGAVWFTFVQAVVLKTFCPWCCSAHALASLGVLIFWMTRTRRAAVAPASGLAFAIPAVAVLALVQALSPQPEQIRRLSVADAAGAGGERSNAKGVPEIDPAGLPRIGAVSAEVTGIAVTDWTCPHCRDLHRTLSEAGGQLTNRLGVAVLPGYHEPAGRELHRVMLTIWKLDPLEYEKISASLIQESVAANAEAVLAQLPAPLKEGFYRTAWEQGDWVQETLGAGQEVMAYNKDRLQLTILPQLMIGQEIVAGPPRLETIVAMALASPPGLPDLVASRVAQPSGPSLPDVTGAAATGVTNTVVVDKLLPGQVGPKIEFEKSVVDVGKVTKGEVAKATFQFKNVGDAPLQLTSLKPGCGCTTVEGWEQTVQPGGTGSFEVNLDTARFTGFQSKSIDYETNQEEGKGRLYINATIWTPVLVTPASLSFGTILKGSTVEPRTVEIAAQDDEVLKIGEITGSNTYFKRELKTIEEGKKYELVISIPELGDRPQVDHLKIPVGHSKMPEVTLQVYASAVDPVMVNPSQIIRPAGAAAAAGTVRLTAYCYDPAVTNFTIMNPAYEGTAAVTVTLDPPPGYQTIGHTWRTLEVTFPVGFDAGVAMKENAQVTFETTHPDYRQVKVPVRTIGGI